MKLFVKWRKKVKYSFAIASAVVCFSFLFIDPIFGAPDYRDGGYYEVTLNNTYVGSVSKPEKAEELIKEARKEISGQTEDLVFMKVDYEINEDDKIFGSVDDEDTVKQAVLDVLNNSIIETKKKAYTLKIGDYSVTLRSKEEILDLLEVSKAKYDDNNEFQIELVNDESSALNSLTAQVVKVETSKNETTPVTATEVEAESQEVSGQTAEATSEVVEEATSEEENSNSDEKVSLNFDDSIEIVETYASEDAFTPLETAIDEVTKDKETNQVYEVSSGDCLSVVAEKNNMSMDQLLQMNTALNAESVLQIGDELVVTVPEPELSVVVQEEVTYQEDYQTETQYVENSSWYTTRSETVQQGEAGVREVTALVTSRNGLETTREIQNETIIKESTPTVIEKGTITPPTYIKPITGGTFTSGFGVRWGKMHEGVDWAVPVGTSVKASSAGTVVSAGWSSGYGYCVTISHADGKQTRYGHLSKILVSTGQKVDQGEKIALSGNTGRSTGPHLHFEIIVNGSQVNPLNYLN